jgi:hypothetical protein
MRIVSLVWGCALSVALVPLACGGDDGDGGAKVPGAAGAAGDGTGPLGAAGDEAAGADGKGKGGEPAIGGAASDGGAGNAMAGQGDGGGGPGNDACTPKTELPAPVVTSLKVQPTCAAPKACGGALEDTQWAYSAVCLEQGTIFQPVYDECPTSKLNGPADIIVSGSLEFSGGSLMHTATVSTTGVFQLPVECHSCDCKGEQEVLKKNGAGPNTYCYPDCYPDLSCRCLIDFEVTVSQEEPYTVDGNTFTLDSGTKYDFCASDSSLALTELGASPGLPGSATLIPAIDTVTPEICDGIDNDKNGEIDDNPVDCPPEPCVNEGVCKGVEPTCQGQWLCDYSAVKREMGDETTCDGLDNDCDGEVDEKLVGCFEKCDGLDNDNDGTIDDDPAGSPCAATLGVCATGATSTCLGAGGWRCDFASSDFEAAETSCDGLDNDCDGQVDEGCSCALGKSQMFVAHWGATPELIRADLDGKNPQLVPALSGFALTKVVVDSKANKLYFGDASDKIQRSNLDGSGIEVVWTGKAQTWNVNPATGLLLGECNTSFVCKLNPPNTTTPLVQPAAVTNLDIDPVNRFVYWADYGSGANYHIRRAGFDGSNVTEVVTDVQAALMMKVDAAGQRLYWPNGLGIYQAHLDGSNEKLFLSLPSSYTYDMAIDHNGGKLYFTDVNANEVRRVGLDGKSYEPLLNDVTYPISIGLYLCP